MTYKLWNISGIDGDGAEVLRNCYKELNSGKKKYSERPDAAHNGKLTIMILTDEKDEKINDFENAYRKIIAELPEDGQYASKLILENEMEPIILDFLGIRKRSESEKFTKYDIDENRTLKENVLSFIYNNYSDKEFSSKDLKRDFEASGGKIGLSTASTYLARMTRKSILESSGNRSNRKYEIKKDGRKTLK